MPTRFMKTDGATYFMEMCPDNPCPGDTPDAKGKIIPGSHARAAHFKARYGRGANVDSAGKSSPSMARAQVVKEFDAMYKASVASPVQQMDGTYDNKAVTV